MNSCIGFSTNATNPMLTTGAFNAPYFDFPASQLFAVPSQTENLRSSKFYTFVDPYGSPYAYLSSRGGAGGVNNTYSADCSLLPYPNANGALAGFANVIPYQRIPASNQQTNFYNPQGFQIISAGYETIVASGQFSPFDTNGIWDYKSGNPFLAAAMAAFTPGDTTVRSPGAQEPLGNWLLQSVPSRVPLLMIRLWMLI